MKSEAGNITMDYIYFSKVNSLDMTYDGVLSILDVDRQGRPGPYYKYYNCS